MENELELEGEPPKGAQWIAVANASAGERPENGKGGMLAFEKDLLSRNSDFY
jgi:hypothetical protein